MIVHQSIRTTVSCGMRRRNPASGRRWYGPWWRTFVRFYRGDNGCSRGVVVCLPGVFATMWRHA